MLERLIRELNARTAGLRDLPTVQKRRLLGRPAWHVLERTTHPCKTIPFRLQKFSAT